MRLICPNCGAQYEVADDVIPELGRDVQCSNCGHTWFEKPGASMAAEEGIDAAGDEGQVPWPDDDHAYYEDEEEPLGESPTMSQAVGFGGQATEDTIPGAIVPKRPDPAAAAPKRQPLAPSIAEILREEAAREAAVRDAERATGLESQGDLGLDDLGRNAPAAQVSPPPVETRRDVDPPGDATEKARLERVKEDELTPIEAAVAATVAASRKEMLPDIEDINATLRPSALRAEAQPLPEEIAQEKRRGFRFGFLSVMCLMVVLGLIYGFAPQISGLVPALSGLLDSYTGAVDALRIALDQQVQNLLASLESTNTPTP